MKPMLAQTGSEDWLDEIESDRDWMVTEKWDGIRLILHLRDSGNKLTTRSERDIIKNTPRFQVIIPGLDGTIIDSEGIAPSGYLGDAQTIVNSLPETAIAWQQVNGHMRLMVFDCLKFKGQWIMTLPFRERRKYLATVYKILRRYQFPVKLETLRSLRKRRYYREVVKGGGEGVMAKDLLAQYYSGQRTGAWVKVKARETYDFVILGFTRGTGKYSNQVGAIRYGAYYEGELIEVGKSSGMTDRERLDMTNRPRAYINKVAEFEAQEITKSGAMRHPEYIQLRPDKKPIECQLEDYLP